MKKSIAILFALVASAAFAMCAAVVVDGVEMLPSYFDGKTPVVVETAAFRFVINPDATARSLVLKATGEECLAPEAGLPVFASVQKRPFNNETRLVQMAKRTMYPANRVRRDGDILRIGFETAPYEVEVRVRERKGYAAFEIVRFISNTVQEKQYGGLEPWKLDVPPVEEFRLLQLPVVERKNFGDWLNVEWDDHVAVAVVGATPFMDVDHEKRGRWRLMRVDALSGIGHGITNGVAVIAAGAGKDAFLAQVEAMENDYDLPRGVASRRHPLLNASIYWMSDLSVHNVDEHIANMKKGGFRMALIYSSGMFLNERAYTHYGNYDLNTERFPNGYDDLKAVLAKIRSAGVAPGFHALQTFIGFKSRYVTPEADPRLSVKRYFALERPLPASGATCDVYVAQNPIDAPMHPMCRILKFGTELMHYDGYTTTPPYRFTGVKRGWFGTTVKEHGRGYFGGILDVCECTATSCCIDQNTSLQDEIGDKIAKVFDCGMEFLYFDGSEDVNAPCNVNISLSQWKVARRCGKMPLFTEGCAKSHFGWHLQSGANAFDVFPPAVFKEKIIEYPYQAAKRLAKDFTRVDFGWWKVFPDTQPDMWEYGTSKAAAFDCPATMQMNLYRVRANGRMDDLFETVRRWEDVRARKWLTPAQKEMLKDPTREFHLYLNETNGYELVEWKQIDVAGGKGSDVRAFLFERGGKRVVAYWHVRDRARLVFAQPIDGVLSLDAAGMKYFETDLPADVVRTAFASAAIQPPTLNSQLSTFNSKLPSRHVPKRIMGRDYWPALYKYRDWIPGAKYANSAFEVRFDNPDIFKLPAFRDAASVYWARNDPPPVDGTSGTWRHFADNFTPDERDREIIDSNPHPDRPFLFAATSKRQFWTWGADIDLDYDEYAAWKAKHPNALYDGTILEWDNDLTLAYSRVAKLTNEVRRAKVEALIGKHPPKTREERMDVMRRHFADRRRASYGGRMAVHASHVFSQHLGADCGAAVIAVETTNSSGSPTSDSEYRWNLAPMFARGAARQFDVPWEWYWAAYMNGFRTNGEWHNSAACTYPHGRAGSPLPDAASLPRRGPEYGISANLMRRIYYFAYLNGANITQPEEWSAYFLTWDENAGKTMLTQRGRDYALYHDFTAKHPGRGVPYAPVAICIPLSRGYTVTGGWPWSGPVYGYTQSDLMSDAVFFSLIPGFERAKAMKAGVETNLHNSRFAQMYDVICPDAPSQSAETVLDVMKSYKALVMAGEFADEKVARCLSEYEKAGGRVVRLPDDAIGKAVSSKPPYQDGHVVQMLKSGKARFPEIETVFEGLQRDYFPFKVEGDCMYGANRTDDGWWLWVFNNKGVTKFTDAPHTVDHSFDVDIAVTYPGGSHFSATELLTGKTIAVASGSFKHRIAAGDLAVFEIKSGRARIPAAQPPANCLAIAQSEFSKYYQAVTGKAPPPDAVKFAVDPSVSRTGRDAYAIVSEGVGVTITGSNVRSVLYGVYDLLERRAGCHWFWDGDVVPKRETIDLSGLDIHEEARFEYRGLRYFAHRGLTRFQAEHWGFDDWKKEIDWMLKRRLNVFMLRIGQDDLFQRTFPDVCAYPDPSKPLPGAGEGYDNRSLFWSLQFRGELRRRVQAYAFERGLMAPEDFGTMTHWYSRTPEDFLEKKNPPFLPQATSGYAEKNGLVWDIRDEKWADEYWKLTKTAVEAYGKGAPQRLLHTIGLGERRCYTNRQDNFNLKIEALDKFLTRAHRDYPDAKVLLAGWDFYFTWHPDEVKSLIGRLDPKRDIIWDYEGDATRDWRKEMQGLNNNFTKWGVVGKFPYTYSIFLAYESALDVRANYPLIEERQRIVQNDPACVGYIFWPESSHTDTLCLRYFTANAWAKEAVPHSKVLDEFCASRYGALAERMKAIWKKVLPASMLRDWDANYGRLVARSAERILQYDEKVIAAWKNPVEAAQTVFGELAEIPWADEFLRRDTIDIARMVLDRVITLRVYELARDIAAWRNGADAHAKSLSERAAQLAALCDTMADLLELHTDYSLWESYLRLDAVEKVRNPDFPKTLFDNASCKYCRSHQYELARHWYAPRVKKMAARLAKVVADGDRNAALFDDPEAERRALMERPLESLKPEQPRTEERRRAVLRACAHEAGKEIL